MAGQHWPVRGGVSLVAWCPGRPSGVTATSQDWAPAVTMSLEETFLEACKAGVMPTVHAALQMGCDPNCSGGWGLRRAVRYNHPELWTLLLAHKDIQVRERVQVPASDCLSFSQTYRTSLACQPCTPPVGSTCLQRCGTCCSTRTSR